MLRARLKHEARLLPSRWASASAQTSTVWQGESGETARLGRATSACNMNLIMQRFAAAAERLAMRKKNYTVAAAAVRPG